MQLYDELCYWIQERERIREQKEAGVLKPWSKDWVFKETYFCNVHREDDRVTKWIRDRWSQKPQVDYVWLMGMARLLNKPETLTHWQHTIPQVEPSHIQDFISFLRERASEGHTIWGNAYVVTTHGLKMDKLEYLELVLKGLLSVEERFQSDNVVTCDHAWRVLQEYEGFGSFMAAQVVADLKNTPWHELSAADDKFWFVAHGPGSLRGLSWVSGIKITPRNFYEEFGILHEQIGLDLPQYNIDGQDLQNCLCEFDKYCRVKNHTGRSKRKYDGS